MTLTEQEATGAQATTVTSRPLALASASPRRAALLRSAGLRFEVAPSDVDESAVTGETPAETARALALAKARHVAAKMPGHAVLAADTVVALDDEELDKPGDAAEAASMLRRLSGRTHTVYTAVALAVDGDIRSEVSETLVEFRTLSSAEIDSYVRSGSPMDKAGAYGIQDADFSPVKSYTGSYTNVVGLPMAETAGLLAEASVISAASAVRMAMGEPG
jgi:septum formation protein